MESLEQAEAVILCCLLEELSTEAVWVQVLCQVKVVPPHDLDAACLSLVGNISQAFKIHNWKNTREIGAGTLINTTVLGSQRGDVSRHSVASHSSLLNI